MAKKILLIEDEKVLAEMYQEKLSESGFEVIWTTEAKDGLELARKEKPDMVLLDILLPRENGVFFLNQLRKDPQISSIPVMVFSNYDDPETKKLAFELRVKDYLIKTNYTPSEIVAKIKQLLSEG